MRNLNNQLFISSPPVAGGEANCVSWRVALLDYNQHPLPIARDHQSRYENLSPYMSACSI